jgi:hypothetical protein
VLFCRSRKSNSQHQGSSVIYSEIQFKGGDHAEEVLSAVGCGKDGACWLQGKGVGALRRGRLRYSCRRKKGETNDTPRHTARRRARRSVSIASTKIQSVNGVTGGKYWRR